MYKGGAKPNKVDEPTDKKSESKSSKGAETSKQSSSSPPKSSKTNWTSKMFGTGWQQGQGDKSYGDYEKYTWYGLIITATITGFFYFFFEDMYSQQITWREFVHK